MNESEPSLQAQQIVFSRRWANDFVIRLAVGFLFAVAAFRILGPFVPLVLWGGVIAIAIYPLVSRLQERLGGRRKLAVTLLVLIAIAIVIAPAVTISASLVETAHELGEGLEKGTLEVPLPPPRVKNWPVIGTKADKFWRLAATNLEGFAKTYGSQMRPMVLQLLSATAGAGVIVIQLIVSLLIAAALLIHAEDSSRGVNALACRIFGAKRGAALTDLAAKTVRSVATGVLGVAIIQAVLAFVGMVVAGVPYAGIWSVLVLVLAIMQLPPVVILLPVAIWVFGSAASQIVTWGFLVWAILVSISDAVLKPLLLGRGVEVPMPVILLGAIGGMIQQGIIGLFVGAVALALFYRFLTEWLSEGMEAPVAELTAEAAES